MTNKKFLIILSIIIIVVTTIPYVIGFLIRPEGTHYTGIHHLAPGDTATYYAFMEQSAQGDWLFTNLYTTEDQPRIYFSPLWLVLGKIGALIKASHTVMFQISRILLIPILVFAIFRFVQHVIRDKKTERIIMLITLFGSGLGAFVTPFVYYHLDATNTPIDFWAPEAIPFLSMFQSPHIIISWILMIVTLYFFLRLLEEKNSRFLFYAICTAMVLFTLHPFYVPTIWGVTGVWVLVTALMLRKGIWRLFLHYFVFIIVSAFPLIYFYWLDKTSAVLHGWSSSNILNSPNPVMYIVGFGLLLPLAIIAAYRTFDNSRLRLMTLWLVTGSALLYIPLIFQRRLVQGLFVPIAMLAGITLMAFYRRFKQRKNVVILIIIICFMIIIPTTNVVNLVLDISYYSDDEPRYWFYIPNDDYNAMIWLRNNTPKEASVLSAPFYVGNLMPAYTGRYVFAGHEPQTLFWDAKSTIVKQFYSNGMTDENRYEFLASNGIDYVFWGKLEKKIGEYDPRASTFLIPVFTSLNVEIFQVVLKR